MKILIIRFSSAGDIVLTSLFVRCARARFPDATIHFLTKKEFVSLVDCSPYLDRVIALPSGGSFGGLRQLKRELREAAGGRYDIVFDLHNSLRSRYVRTGLGRACSVVHKPSLAKWLLVHRKINRLRPIVPIPELYLRTGAAYGITNDGQGLDLHTGTVRSPLEPETHRPTIALAPGARHATKRWPAERFAALGTQLAAEFGARIALMGSPAERELCEQITRAMPGVHAVNLAGATDYTQAAAAMDACAALVTNDSALAHIAAARKRPVVAIFGSTVQEFGFAPYGTQSVVVEVAGLACRPCTTIGREACPLGHFRCMLEIDAGTVARAVRGFIGDVERAFPR